jgi:hypothetical protein
MLPFNVSCVTDTSLLPCDLNSFAFLSAESFVLKGDAYLLPSLPFHLAT